MREREYRSRPHVKRLRRSLTRAETMLWARLKSLRARGYRFRRQHPVDNYIVDFANIENRLAIEVDGATHSEDHEVAYDEARTQTLASLGWSVLRILNTDVYDDPDEVVEHILSRLPPPSAPLTPPPHAGEEGQAANNITNRTETREQTR